MNADPLHYPRDHHTLRTCETCGSSSLTSGRLTASGLDRVEMFACDTCGDFWFERDAVRMTADAMRRLGLLAG